MLGGAARRVAGHNHGLAKGAGERNTRERERVRAWARQMDGIAGVYTRRIAAKDDAPHVGNMGASPGLSR